MRAFQMVGMAVVLWIFTSCEVSQRATGKLVHYEVEDEVNKPQPQYAPYHMNDQLTRVHWRVSRESMLVMRNDDEQQVFNFRFRYRVFQNYSTRTPLDSGSFVIKDFPNDPEEGDFITGYFDLKLASGFNYVVQVNLYDLNRSVERISLVDIVKADPLASHFFEAFDPMGNRVFTEYTAMPGVHSARYSQPVERLWVRFYSREFPAASAPFTATNPKPFDFTPDSLFAIERSEDGTFKVSIFRTGFYQLAPDSAKQKGLTLFYHSVYYPEQKTVLDLIHPMRYITTNQEFERLMEGNNMKRNVDEFWLSVGGSPERARKIIRAYYDRVEYSNGHFNSYIEGWKTDRGMCFIVFGQPDAVHRTTSAEKWVYGESGRYNSLTLTFTKVMNPFTNNDFRLNRSSSLKTPWYRAVEFWRQGRVVSYR